MECKLITSLTLPSSLGQHFFDFQLYDLCPNINELDICGDEILICEFIFKFKYIRQLFVCKPLSIEFERRLAESYKRIRVGFDYFHNRGGNIIVLCKEKSFFLARTIPFVLQGNFLCKEK